MILEEEIKITTDFSNYKYGFLVKDAIKFKEPIPALGKLGFFDIDFNP